MKVYLKFVFIALFMANLSCSSNNKDGINEIESFYGGSCSVEYGQMYQNKKSNNFINITMIDSEYLEYFKSDLSLPASNIAILFLKHLKNKNKYSEIRIEIKLKDDFFEKRFYSNELIKIISKKNIYDDLFEMITNQKYDDLYEHLDSRIKEKLKKEDFIESVIKIDNKYGKPTKIITQGAHIDKKEVNDKFYQYIETKCTIVRTNKNTKISIFLDIETNKILSFQFNW